MMEIEKVRLHSTYGSCYAGSVPADEQFPGKGTRFGALGVDGAMRSLFADMLATVLCGASYVPPATHKAFAVHADGLRHIVDAMIDEKLAAAKSNSAEPLRAEVGVHSLGNALDVFGAPGVEELEQRCAALSSDRNAAVRILRELTDAYGQVPIAGTPRLRCLAAHGEAREYLSKTPMKASDK